ncbi:PREDICTED: N-acetylneuraminate lyase-like [Nicrophorus vespilloides]|uniref:N-acetylneuraminate lyase n=1 Tax=Nicrophorus vespilloides TaxID=110193 RepID=A0ABM1M764_NICVS|nr:PREDICTED: N-acetylneuraminate lyase-like [Nicrophorus vespilloides]
MKLPFRGLIAPVFTPFNNDEKNSINFNVLPEYVKYLSAENINGILVNGTSGEGMSLTVEERKLLCDAWLRASLPETHVMVQVGGLPLPYVLELAEHAEKAGAHSLLCLPDLYNKPNNNEELIEYLKLVSKAAPNTPLLYYHIPMFTNVNIDMGKFLNDRVNEVPTFAGIKFTSNDLKEGIEAVNAKNKEFAVFLGADMLMAESYALGFDSSIATTLNIFPTLGVNIKKFHNENKFELVEENQSRLSNNVTTITKYGGWVSSMKSAMNLFTRINCGPVRAPIVPVPQRLMNILRNDVERAAEKRQ